MKRRLVVVLSAVGLSISGLALAVPAAAGGGCHYSSASDAHGTTVEIKDACFQANVLHARVGDTITWVNNDDMAHTVTGVAGSWGSLETQLHLHDHLSYKFTTNGVYPYFCLLHPAMAGAIVIGDGSGAGPATATHDAEPLSVILNLPTPNSAPAVTAKSSRPASTTTPSTGRDFLPGLLIVAIGIAGGAGYLAGRRALTRRGTTR